jgi:hypothetical protein
VAKDFPGTPLQTLKARYANMKAKTIEWNTEAVYILSDLTNCRMQILQGIGMSIKPRSGRWLRREWGCPSKLVECGANNWG